MLSQAIRLGILDTLLSETDDFMFNVLVMSMNHADKTRIDELETAITDQAIATRNQIADMLSKIKTKK
jgi:hypothetical protein